MNHHKSFVSQIYLQLLVIFLWSGFSISSGWGQAKFEFFEKHIRPVLVEHCYECHNSSDRDDASLALDHRQGVLDGGDSGPAIVPGKPEKSLLLSAIRHTDPDLRMPENNAKLSPQTIADFEKWIRAGAPDPRDKPPSATELAKSISWETIRDKRKQWWSFQPIAPVKIPPTTTWSSHPIDRFIHRRLRQKNLKPNHKADKLTLIRRVYFTTIGLPPTPAEIDAFVADTSPDAYEKLITRLLDSPRFGERWARHWMDWVRYSESHGSEGNPQIPFAYRYRDYLIRALNDDVAYDQLVREHIAGDLLEKPRINKKLGLNESQIGTGHYRFVEHGYGPTDALEEQVRFTENQIDVITKAFLGLTVSCARCHDHKFDAVSQADFYALYGIMTNSRSSLLSVDAPEKLNLHRAELTKIKTEIKSVLAKKWLDSLAQLPRQLDAFPNPTPPKSRQNKRALQQRSLLQRVVDAAHGNPRDPLHVWVKAKIDPKNTKTIWNQIHKQFDESRARLDQRQRQKHSVRWNLSSGERQKQWIRHGNGLHQRQYRPGEFHINESGNLIISNIYPAGIYSHLLSNKHSGILTSPRFDIDQDELWVRVAGRGGSRVRYVVQNYPRVSGPVYKAAGLNSETSRWIRWDMKYWRGDQAYIEIATAMDIPVENRNTTRSWFGIMDVVTVHGKQQRPVDEIAEFIAPLFAKSSPPAALDELKQKYVIALKQAIVAWRDNTMTDEQARFLGYFVRNNILANQTNHSQQIESLVAKYRHLESEIPTPTRAPGVIASENRDHPMFVRGNHKRPGKIVARRFLEAFDDRPYGKHKNARLQLAEDFTADENPLFARVMVNRIWHHVFGRGIVTTTDNFGRLGRQPTHPELLDHLAIQFKNDRYSIKKMIRYLLTSETFQMSSTPSATSEKIDPGNQYLSRMSVRRLEAEAIRDKMLAISGRIDLKPFGPSVSGNSPRRSVYVAVRRNALDPFLNVFDAPAPFSTKGSRDVTNVPAQSLAMMNNPLVNQLAIAWVDSVVKNPELKTDSQRVRRLFAMALGRQPTAQELEQSLDFMKDVSARSAILKSQLQTRTHRIAFLERQIESMLAPVRKKILADRKSGKSKPIDLKPIAHWSFDRDFRDAIGNLHGKPVDNARISNGRLILDGKSFVMTGLLSTDLAAKTLEVWVTVDGLQQQGGGVMTVQTQNGSVFDSIVYAERQKHRWMAGSNFFARTRDFGGPAETQSAKDNLIHLAIVYHSDGTITCYRNGKLYGKPYKTNLQKFDGKQSQILFGLRHGTPERRTTHFRGAIDRANLYDRALTADEIKLSATGKSNFVAIAEIEQRLTPAQRKTLKKLQVELDSEKNQRDKIIAQGPVKQINPWHELGKAIFSFKEFIYIR